MIPRFRPLISKKKSHFHRKLRGLHFHIILILVSFMYSGTPLRPTCPVQMGKMEWLNRAYHFRVMKRRRSGWTFNRSRPRRRWSRPLSATGFRVSRSRSTGSRLTGVWQKRNTAPHPGFCIPEWKRRPHCKRGVLFSWSNPLMISVVSKNTKVKPIFQTMDGFADGRETCQHSVFRVKWG